MGWMIRTKMTVWIIDKPLADLTLVIFFACRLQSAKIAPAGELWQTVYMVEEQSQKFLKEAT